MSNRKQRIVFGVLAVLAGLAMFMVASSYIVARGLPHWLAAIVGAFAFPVAPVGWHIWSERRRRKKVSVAKSAPKATLTGADRYWLRTLAVAIVVLGPMIAIGKFGVVRAVVKHGLWFWPESSKPGPGSLTAIGSGTQRGIQVLGTPLARVPADAELVVMVEPPADEHTDGRAVMAWGNRQLLVVAEGKKILAEDPTAKLAELNKQRNKFSWFPVDEVVEVKRSDAEYIAASQGWRYRVEPPGTGPGVELVRELGRSPKDALVYAAYAPKTTHDIRAGAAWLIHRNDKLIVEGRVEASDEAAAKKLVAEAQTALSKAAKDAPESCHDQVDALAKAVQLDQRGTVITARVETDAGTLVGIAFCALRE